MEAPSIALVRRADIMYSFIEKNEKTGSRGINQVEDDGKHAGAWGQRGEEGGNRFLLR